jgi:hypothetical protein
MPAMYVINAGMSRANTLCANIGETSTLRKIMWGGQENYCKDFLNQARKKANLRKLKLA